MEGSYSSHRRPATALQLASAKPVGRPAAIWCALVLAAVAALGSATPASSAVSPWVREAGDHFVDTRSGRVVVLRGFDVMAGTGRNAREAIALGATLVRIPVPWSAVEPTAPRGSSHRWDAAVLGRLDATIRTYQAAGVNVLIDFHQVRWSLYFPTNGLNAQGVPGWYYAGGRFPATADGRADAEQAFFTTEAARSQRAYAAFATMMTARYRSFPNVVGYEILNEPTYGELGAHIGAHAATAAMLDWQGQIRAAIQRVDPQRAVFVSVHGGGEGVGTANLRRLGDTSHVVLDYHDFFNGVGPGLDPSGDEWTPSWAATHNQFVTNYRGTREAQRHVLMVAMRRAALTGVPLLVGEWGARADDRNGATYQAQMLDLFGHYGVSWTRWIVNRRDRFALLNHEGVPTTQARQLEEALQRSPTVTSFPGPVLRITRLAASPSDVLSHTTISWSLNRSANVRVVIAHRRNGVVVRHFPSSHFPAGGVGRRVWRGRNDAGDRVRGGRYTVTITATNRRGEQVTRSIVIRVS